MLIPDLEMRSLRELPKGKTMNVNGYKIEPGASLIDADLRGADLNCASLIDADLSGANLRGANLSGANLIDAKMRESDLSGAILRGVNLSGADLSSANLLAYGDGWVLKTFQLGKWPAGHWNGILQIGCQTHTVEKWAKWDNQAGRKWISAMNDDALEWAEKYLDLVLAAVSD